MTAREYFGDYYKCINVEELNKILKKLQVLYTKEYICPAFNDVFKAFTLCPYNSLKVIMLGQDPYPQKGVATGLAFANKRDTKELSPSLEVLKKCAINFEVPHNFITFAPDLEEWEKQGVLLLNSALTVEMNKIGSHSNMWRPFISSFLYNLSMYNTGLIYVLFGKQAQSFKSYIGNRGIIIESPHPSYFARLKTKMPYGLFTNINKLVKEGWNTTINWYNEL